MFGGSAIWALDDFSDANGATEVIPGSHLWEDEQAPTPEDPRTVSIVMPAGSVVVIAGNLYHRGGANRSAGKRLGLTIQYCQPWLRQLENMMLAVPPDLAAQYSERIQEMVGYSIVSGTFVGYVDGRHPRKLITRRGQAS